MTIWLLALLLLGSLAGIGYRQGVIRVGFSLVGILLGALLAVPLGKLLRPALMAVGLKNPVLAWLLGPFIVFVVISIIFKIVALNVHEKVDVKFRYHAGDLRLAPDIGRKLRTARSVRDLLRQMRESREEG